MVQLTLPSEGDAMSALMCKCLKSAMKAMFKTTRIPTPLMKVALPGYGNVTVGGLPPNSDERTANVERGLRSMLWRDRAVK